MSKLKSFLPFIIINIFLVYGFSISVLAATVPTRPPANVDPGAQLNQDKERLREQRIKKELEEQKERQDEAVETEEKKEKPPDESKSVKINLEKVEFSSSSLFSEEELASVANKYIGKEVTVAELYDMVNEINKLYVDKGYIVCRAFLPEQTIEDGVVKVLLVEGVTDSIFIEGNKTTNEYYIRKRLPLVAGEVSNANDLNRALVWFNNTNSIQLQVEIKPGSKSATSDYHITAYEPKRYSFTVFTDNIGSESTGEWRTGLSYMNRSLSGNRDELSITGLASQGTTAGTFSYNIPITAKGAKLGLEYSANSTKIKNGELKDLDITGNSTSFGVNINQPLVVTSKKQIEAFLEWRQQNSKTNIMTFDWVDDKINTYALGLSFTNFRKSSLIYHRHSYSFGSWEDIVGDTKDYSKYNLFGLYQKSSKKNRLLTLKLHAQLTPDNFLPSTDQFYIGGLYSVRGYKESFLGADSGVSLSAEYNIPSGKAGNFFVFTDCGVVFGDNAFDDNKLFSAGFGYRHDFAKQTSTILTLGFPFRTDYNGESIDSMRANFSISHQF